MWIIIKKFIKRSIFMVNIQNESFNLSKRQIQDIATTIYSDVLEYIAEEEDTFKQYQKNQEKEKSK